MYNAMGPAGEEKRKAGYKRYSCANDEHNCRILNRTTAISSRIRRWWIRSTNYEFRPYSTDQQVITGRVIVTNRPPGNRNPLPVGVIRKRHAF
ncbi:unnamed protein product [Soboliphyme baturini]|uniref:MSP domain-containing protein n=1 Tax=Soboliphyme baturini TaxID=241478 RepID=A0A183IE14_9BILA|nr:unnamed protein product [Soboliphyme baturini]